MVIVAEFPKAARRSKQLQQSIFQNFAYLVVAKFPLAKQNTKLAQNQWMR